MYKLPIQNIANKKRDIYLFLREGSDQRIEIVKDFYPFYYEPDHQGKFTSYDGIKLRKVYCTYPNDISASRSVNSYSSDIKFTTNFLFHKVDEIIYSKPKYLFLDIEVLVNNLSDIEGSKSTISCVSIYNNLYEDMQTWYIEDMPAANIDKKELILLHNLINYIKKEAPDIILAWNINFDYSYLYRRAKTLGIDFAREISPISSGRAGEVREIFYPAGISIVDYMTLWKKVYMREQSYALDNIAQKYLKEKKWKTTDFSKLSNDIKEKNSNDVLRLVKLEKDKQLIPYYDELRRLAKIQWEDLYHNSRISEALIFEEALKKDIVLPNKPIVNETNDNDEENTFQGATRDCLKTGFFKDIGKFDLSSAYPSMIFNFCLDIANVRTKKEDSTILINGLYFKQDSQAILPTAVKKILVLKDKLKKLKKENPNDDNISKRYDAIKAIVNSLFGTIGNKYFRLYNLDVASTITFLVRELLTYVQERIKKDLGYEILYFDTDSIFVNTKENITAKLNQFIRDWAKEKYGKDNLELDFTYEGYFNKLFLLGTCHYYGYTNGKKEPEIRGIEAKRASSSKYEAWFQEEHINKVLNGATDKEILDWIEKERERIRTLAIEEIAFPTKLSNKEYKNVPIFVRAVNNTKRIVPNFKPKIGELFYYIFVKDRNKEVLAFTEDNKDFIKKEDVDYSKIIERAIYNKADKIFHAMGWYLSRNTNQSSLF